MVVSFPLASSPAVLTLTPSEQDVVQKIIHGRSNADIAALRSTSIRTVANQVASIFRKLGVTSRGELIARHARATSTH